MRTHSRDLLWGGLMIFLVAGTRAADPVVFRGVSGQAVMLTGCLQLLDLDLGPRPSLLFLPDRASWMVAVPQPWKWNSPPGRPPMP